MSQALAFALMTLASYRLWRFAAEDTAPFLKRPRDALLRWLGPQSSLAELLLCPWCLGAYISFALVAVTAQVVHVQLPVLQALAVSALVGAISTFVDE